MSEISADKLQAYYKTHYRVFHPENPFILQIGTYSIDLQNLFQQTNHTCAIFITAYNPFGSIQSDEDNLAAHQLMSDHLRSLTEAVWEGEGADPTEQWPAEASFLALGIDHDTARQLGNRAHQDAVIWTGAQAIPELILLR